MADNQLTYRIALSMIKHGGAPLVHALDDAGITPEDFFGMDMDQLCSSLHLHRANGYEKMEREEALFRARKEEALIERHNIGVMSMLDASYPVRLREAPDAPSLLYRLGTADLDSRHVVSIVGTRRPTAYGVDFCNKLVADLAVYFPDLLVVSGLAFGIDAVAHTAALQNNVSTVGVVAHGLDMIYPAAHRDLARTILQKGGSIVTEYPFGEKPFRQRFLERNRIVAALSDVIVVVESDLKGGAMSTANLAFSYCREVMALPGRISDKLSSGCNHLIRKEKAHLITCAADLIELTGWQPLDLNVEASRRNLFPELDGDARQIYETLRFAADPLTADRIHMLTLIPMPRLMTELGEMEFDGIVIRHPGNRYSVS